MLLVTMVLSLALGAPGAVHRGGAVASAGPGASASSDEVAAQVDLLLGSIDTRIPAARWRALGERGVTRLAAVLGDRANLPSRRARAVQALSVIGGPRAKGLVLATAAAENEGFAVRAAALRAAPAVAPEPELVSALEPVLKAAQEAPVRATAAEVLARHAGEVSCAAVRARAGTESGRSRLLFGRALQACGVSGP